MLAALWVIGIMAGIEEVVWDVQPMANTGPPFAPPPPPPPKTVQTQPAVTIVLVGQVIVDIFFRIEYFRHVLLGQFPDVTFETVPTHPAPREAIEAVWNRSRAGNQKGREINAMNRDGVVLLAMLRDDADNILLRGKRQPPTWLKHIGVLHIDDEKLTSSQRFAPFIGFTVSAPSPSPPPSQRATNSRVLMEL